MFPEFLQKQNEVISGVTIEKFMKTNLSGPAFEKYGKYVVTQIIDLINFALKNK